MIEVEEFNEEDETNYKLYTQTLNYRFDPQRYVIQTADENDIEEDRVLATEIKRYYSELNDWEAKPLVRAWRRYSEDVCSIDEEYVCVRTPDFLAYLYVVQEEWFLGDKTWLELVQEAVNILWPHAIQKNAID
jgi:hypothetical protein